ncbi:cytochrome C [Sulfurimonas sp.]|nr:cytochrome C [Sulfurimonas sp.]
MNKFFMFLFSILVLTSLSSSAAIYKGQREFVKKCVKCHKAGQAFVATKKKRTWKKLLAKKGKQLAQLHINSTKKKAKKSKKYFKKRKFKKKAKHLKQFLMEYASDSGNVPACN